MNIKVPIEFIEYALNEHLYKGGLIEANQFILVEGLEIDEDSKTGEIIFDFEINTYEKRMN